MPGVVLHAALERMDDLALQGGGGLGEGEVLEVVAAWSRLAAAAEARVRAWAAVLADRSSMTPQWRTLTGRRTEVAADEIGFRLGVSRRRGQQLIDEGRALGGVLAPVQEELAAGRIDAGKAAIMVEALGEQEAHVAAAVCEQVLPAAPVLDHAGLRRRVQQEVVRVAPDEAGVRHARAVARRRVNRVRVLPDGMASFSAVLAAPDAVALEQVCESAARAARAGGDGRTLEQLRADTLAGMATSALDQGRVTLLPPTMLSHTGHGARPSPATTRRPARAAEPRRHALPAAAPLPTIPTPVAGSGPAGVPFDASVSASVSSLARPTASGRDGAAPAGPCTVPVSFSGRSAGLTVIATAEVQQGRDRATTLATVAAHDLYTWEPDPWNLDPDLEARGPAERPGTRNGSGGSGSGSGDRLMRPPVQDLDPGNDPYVDWSPPPVLRPGVDVPELVGYGALSPGVVRALQGAARWITVVEPVHPDADPPPPVDCYRPSAALDRYVRLRDVTCVVPGCQVPAARCDLDHLLPWPVGATAAENLHALCRHHHLLRTHAGHELTLESDGTRHWRTPTGQTLYSTSDGAIGRGHAPPVNSPTRWARTRALPPLTDAEVERRIHDLDDAETDDPTIDDFTAV
ncbi:HNH endonuclease signature motif containing protein [Litorihabitans aurantiacus]|nr:HNH endonuclease signature motif containing protein [Litorihabitans aurantiacus]